MLSIDELPRLSVIITVSNYAQNKLNLKKILNDTSSHNLEVLVIADCFSTRALRELENFCRGLGLPGKIINSSANNPGGSRNLGLLMSSSDWVTFWDCDDLPDIPGYLNLVVKVVRDGATIGIGAFEIEDIESGKLIPSESTNKLDLMNVGLNPGLWRMVFQRQILDNLKFPELSMGEDQVFLQRVLNKNPKITYDKSVIYRYRRGISTQLTNNKSKRLDLLKAHLIASSEFYDTSLHTEITRTMLIRQAITIVRMREVSIGRKLPAIKVLVRLTSKSPGILMKVFAQRNLIPK